MPRMPRCIRFFMSSTTTPAEGPSMTPASSAGISLKSSFRYPPKMGTSIKYSTVASIDSTPVKTTYLVFLLICMTQSSLTGTTAYEKPRTQKRRGDDFSAVFFHPDYTVGHGIQPYSAPRRTLAGLSAHAALPPVGNLTPPQRHLICMTINYHRFMRLSTDGGFKFGPVYDKL